MSVKKNFFKKWLSYIFPLTIEQAASDYNPELDVILKNGRYQLLSSNAIYSYEDKYDNFGKSFKAMNWESFNPKNTLILGLGLGSVIQLLEQKVGIKTSFTAVEIDESVIYLAEKYIMQSITSPVQIICNDAANFVEMTEEKYDLILVDVFEDDLIPGSIQSVDFLKSLQKLLNIDGLILFNSLAYTEKDRRLSSIFYKSKFKKVFPSGHLLDVHENYMLFSQTKYLK